MNPKQVKILCNIWLLYAVSTIIFLGCLTLILSNTEFQHWSMYVKVATTVGIATCFVWWFWIVASVKSVAVWWDKLHADLRSVTDLIKETNADVKELKLTHQRTKNTP